MLVKVFEQIKYLQICDAGIEKSDGEKTAFAHKRDAYIMSSAAELRPRQRAAFTLYASTSTVKREPLLLLLELRTKYGAVWNSVHLS